ncbi:MAG: hypothetical protein AAFV32_04115 [Myxococcota bacterium]
MTRLCLVLSALPLACGGATSSRPTASIPVATPSTQAPIPDWAQDGDRQSGDGYVFNCQGEGQSQDEAIRSATAICNDKICKLCGVVVESIVRTDETLDGVSMQRTVVERCQRVRTEDTEPVYSSQNCGPGGCTAWVQLRYSEDDRNRECRAYADENFADPAECERLITEFARVEGMTEVSFATRRDLLDQALLACAEIDVRPTPLIEALGRELYEGMLAPRFRFNEAIKRADADASPRTKLRASRDINNERNRGRLAKQFYRPLSEPELTKTKTLVARIQKVRDLMEYTRKIVAAGEAFLVEKPDLKRVLALIDQVPDEPDLRRWVVDYFDSRKLNAKMLEDWVKRSFSPQATSSRDAFRVTGLLVADDKVTDTEWQYLVALHEASERGCTACLGRAIGADERSGFKTRRQRLLQALKLYEKMEDGERRLRYSVELLPDEPKFVLDIEPDLPGPVRARLDVEFWQKLRRLAYHPGGSYPSESQEDIMRIRRRTRQAWIAAIENTDSERRACLSIGEELGPLFDISKEYRPLDAAVCRCLENTEVGVSPVNSGNMAPLYRYAVERDLKCVKPRGPRS